METRTVEQVESWSTRSFADGFAGLRELSDGEFSGAVRAGGAWLFMLNGRIIGVYEGSLDDFQDVDGTAYAAPHPSLPLLFSMREQGGDTRAKYYTNDTPLEEVDSTLSQGSFTGYVELSENVLSGDYYVAFYGGRSMSVAFVGASEQVVTGDEAFERAADEVGIYEVVDVDLEIIDLPEPAGSDDPDPVAETPASETTDVASDDSTDSSPTDAAQADARTGPGDSPDNRSGKDSSQSPRSETDTDPETTGEGGVGTTADAERSHTATDDIRQPETETEATEERTTASEDAAAESSPAQSGSSEEASTEAADTKDTSAEAASVKEASTGVTDIQEDGTEATTANATRPAAAGQTESPDADSETPTSETDEDESDTFSEEKEWREATTIPSLDPDRSEGPEPSTSSKSATSTGTASAESASTGSASTGTASAESSSTQSSSSRSTSATSGGNKKRSTSSRTETDGQSQANDGASPNRQSRKRATKSSKTTSKEQSSSVTGTSKSGSDEEVRVRLKKLRSQLKQRKQQVQQLKERLSTVESNCSEYERERNALRQEVKRLEARLENVAATDSGGNGQQLARAQAFDETNLFVRYQSKGKATLEEAASGDVDPDDVNANLRLEHHTQFEADGATVDGRPFEEFLADSFEHRFVSWVIEELLYEIRETGHRGRLSALYEAIPAIDRIDLHGSVNAGGEEADTRKESFDVIMRDRMGNPLLVADLNDSRDPTTGEMMGSLVDAATGVAEAYDELAGALQVTESFFEPKALETAETATSGGFLSREKRESFVKLSRKRGYHLCLVESRSGGFHLNVPEL